MALVHIVVHTIPGWYLVCTIKVLYGTWYPYICMNTIHCAYRYLYRYWVYTSCVDVYHYSFIHYSYGTGTMVQYHTGINRWSGM